jgi:hypothetical protein
MREVSDAFLLNMAEVSATLIGLFLVGVFFYVETGFQRSGPVRNVFEAYIRSGTRITLVVFAFPIGISLTLVVLEFIWVRLLFVVLSVLLLVANVDSVIRVRGLAKVTRSSPGLLLHEIVSTILAQTMIAIPWILGGLHPTRKDFTWAVILAFAVGFTSISATVMSAFAASNETETQPAEADGEPPAEVEHRPEATRTNGKEPT